MTLAGAESALSLSATAKTLKRFTPSSLSRFVRFSISRIFSPAVWQKCFGTVFIYAGSGIEPAAKSSGLSFKTLRP